MRAWRLGYFLASLAVWSGLAQAQAPSGAAPAYEALPHYTAPLPSPRHGAGIAGSRTQTAPIVPIPIPGAPPRSATPPEPETIPTPASGSNFNVSATPTAPAESERGPFSSPTAAVPPNSFVAPSGNLPAGETPASSATTSAANPPADEAIATRQNAFNIPFQIPQVLDVRDQPIEVQLFVSVDRGAQWKLYGSQNPGAGGFNFRTAGDGEYWFASRTIDRLGNVNPQGDLRPELRVIVDTTPPQLELLALAGPSGEVRTSWRVTDAHLASETLQLHYQTSPSQPFKQVAIEPAPNAATPGLLSGEATWWPGVDDRDINIRAEVRDRAGNTTVVQRRLPLDPVALRKPAGPATVSPATPPQAALPTPTNSMARSAIPPAAPTSQPPLAGFASGVPATLNPASSEGGIAWPVDRSANAPPGHGGFTQTNRTQIANNSPPPGQRMDEITSIAPGTLPRPGTVPSPSPPHQGSIGRYASLPVSPQPPVGQRVAAGDPDTVANSSFDFGLLPPGEQPKMTNSQRFNLEYDVESLGPSGIALVELWGTADGGRTWRTWGFDQDRQSPFPVTVPGEGLYGFRIVITSGNGLASRTPQAGDLAEVWVGVDSTPPTARVTSAVYGTGQRVGELDIGWQAEDARLSEHPVTLLFSDRPGGPWTTIASGLTNTGRYSWRVDSRVPRQIFLRLEVRDDAGNVSVHELEQPIANDGLVPQGRILGVRP